MYGSDIFITLGKYFVVNQRPITFVYVATLIFVSICVCKEAQIWRDWLLLVPPYKMSEQTEIICPLSIQLNTKIMEAYPIFCASTVISL